jgi:hypothetical protein
MINLSYLMGASQISDSELEGMGITIRGKTNDGDRKLEIPEENLNLYLALIREKLDRGFWNEVVGEKEIKFIFKFSDGTLGEYVLSPENEQEIDNFCAQLNHEPVHEPANVYKYISENSFYHDFMLEHYRGLINR